MKIKYEKHSERVSLKKKTFFLDVKESKSGDPYLSITESRKMGDDFFARQRINVFEQGLAQFSASLMKMLIYFQIGPEDRNAFIAAMQKKHPKAFVKWSGEDDLALEVLTGEEQTIEDLALYLQRSPTAVKSRLQKRGLDIKNAA